MASTPQTPRQSTGIERAFVATRSGRIHMASAGTGFPVLLLHQTPRSWDEYREVLPLLGRNYRAIAMDTLGFGDSQALPANENTITRWAQGALDLMDALDITRFAVVGHHTGAVVAMEVAAAAPERVAALGLSSCPFITAQRRLDHQGKRVIDDVEQRADGSHLTELWQRRQPFYPADGIALLERFMSDALKAGELAAGGHRVVNGYEMERRIGLVSCPTLVMAATDDPHAYGSAAKVAQAIAGSTLVEIQGGGVPLPDQLPQQFADTVGGFLQRQSLN